MSNISYFDFKQAEDLINSFEEVDKRTYYKEMNEILRIKRRSEMVIILDCHKAPDKKTDISIRLRIDKQQTDINVKCWLDMFNFITGETINSDLSHRYYIKRSFPITQFINVILHISDKSTLKKIANYTKTPILK